MKLSMLTNEGLDYLLEKYRDRLQKDSRMIDLIIIEKKKRETK